jgi:hypothetical protein
VTKAGRLDGDDRCRHENLGDAAISKTAKAREIDCRGKLNGVQMRAEAECEIVKSANGFRDKNGVKMERNAITREVQNRVGLIININRFGNDDGLALRLGLARLKEPSDLSKWDSVGQSETLRDFRWIEIVRNAVENCCLGGA